MVRRARQCLLRTVPSTGSASHSKIAQGGIVQMQTHRELEHDVRGSRVINV